MFDESEQYTTSNNLIRAFLKFRRMGMNKGGRFMPDEKGPCGLRHSEIMLLFALKDMEDKFPDGISVSDLSNHLQVKSPTITPMLSNLEKSGMLERRMDPNDRRIVRIKLKEGGNQFIDISSQHFTDHIQGLVDYLGDEKSNTLASLMNEVYEYFDQKHPHQ